MRAPDPGTPSRRRRLAGAGVGGIVGLLAGGAVYALGSPMLERSAGLLRELQGPLWNVVPVLAVVGAAAGWALAARSR